LGKEANRRAIVRADSPIALNRDCARNCLAIIAKPRRKIDEARMFSIQFQIDDPDAPFIDQRP